MGKLIIAAVFVFCVTFPSTTSGYKILGIFPSSSRSHYIVGSALMKGLAAKGHDVSVITAFPSNDGTENLEEIPITEILEHFKDLHKTLQQVGEKYYIQIVREMDESGRTISEKVLEHPNVQELLTSSNRTFDLIICEIFFTDPLVGFGQHFNAPVIGISPMGNNFMTSALSGSPTPPSFMPNLFQRFTDHMNFLQRVLNLAELTIQYLGYQYHWLPYQSKVYTKFFPNAKITLPEALKNVSLILLNQHVSIGNSEPLVHSMIEVGGLHIQRQVKQLPLRIKEFLDNATNGAIYFSLGTNWKSECLRKDKLDAILNTFRSLKQRVIWKYENSSLPGKSDNVLISDWLPQNDILAHPNVKLFITHGGLLGTTEAVYHAKPLLAIPMLFDQFINAARAVAKGYALEVPHTQIVDKKFRWTIGELLANPKYTKKAQLISARYRDQPMAPLETAIYWVEYVLRHRGAPHLRSASLDLNFIQYHSLDTILVLYGGVLFVFFLLGRLLKKNIAHILGFDKDSKQKND